MTPLWTDVARVLLRAERRLNAERIAVSARHPDRTEETAGGSTRPAVGEEVRDADATASH